MIREKLIRWIAKRLGVKLDKPSAKPPESAVAVAIEKREQFDLLDRFEDVPADKIWQHTPEQSLQPADETGQLLTAAQAKSRVTMPIHYANPMQFLDYRIYESLMKTTFIGALCDAYLKYLIAEASNQS